MSYTAELVVVFHIPRFLRSLIKPLEVEISQNTSFSLDLPFWSQSLMSSVVQEDILWSLSNRVDDAEEDALLEVNADENQLNSYITIASLVTKYASISVVKKYANFRSKGLIFAQPPN